MSRPLSCPLCSAHTRTQMLVFILSLLLPTNSHFHRVWTSRAKELAPEPEPAPGRRSVAAHCLSQEQAGPVKCTEHQSAPQRPSYSTYRVPVSLPSPPAARPTSSRLQQRAQALLRPPRDESQAPRSQPRALPVFGLKLTSHRNIHCTQTATQRPGPHSCQ